MPSYTVLITSANREFPVMTYNIGRVSLDHAIAFAKTELVYRRSLWSTECPYTQWAVMEVSPDETATTIVQRGTIDV